MFLFSLLQTPPCSLITLFSLLVSISSISCYFQDDLVLYGSDEDDSSPSEDSKTPASLTSSAQSSGDLGQPQKKKKKVSPSSLAMPVTGPAAQSCKVICCNKMQGKRQTIARSFDELTSHIRSILNGSDANDGLLEDWAFIGMLFSLEILLSHLLSIYYLISWMWFEVMINWRKFSFHVMIFHVLKRQGIEHLWMNL